MGEDIKWFITEIGFPGALLMLGLFATWKFAGWVGRQVDWFALNVVLPVVTQWVATMKHIDDCMDTLKTAVTAIQASIEDIQARIEAIERKQQE